MKEISGWDISTGNQSEASEIELKIKWNKWVSSAVT